MTGSDIKRHPSRQNVKVAVDNAIFTLINGQLNILLIQMKREEFSGKWALPGGLIFDNESLDSAAVRVLFEETGVKDVYLEQLYTFGEPTRDSIGRVVSTAYFALIPSGNIKLETNKKYMDVQWWQFSEIPRLAYDHNEIAYRAKERLETKITYSNIVWSLLPRKFVLSELQNVYEVILGRRLDKRNFLKKFLSFQLIEPVGKSVTRGAHRPAMLYQFKTRKTKTLHLF